MAIVTQFGDDEFRVILNDSEQKMYEDYARCMKTMPFIVFQEFVNRHLKPIETYFKKDLSPDGHTNSRP